MFGIILICVMLSTTMSGTTFEGIVSEGQRGRALNAARVRLSKSEAAFLVADIETNPEGAFKLENVAQGEYDVEVSKPNYVSVLSRVQLGDNTPLTVRLVISLTRCGVITGQVTDRQGRVAIVMPMKKSAHGAFWVPFRTPVAADDNGQYYIGALPPGQYAVAAAYARTGMTQQPRVWLRPNDPRRQFFRVSGGEEYTDVDISMSHDRTHSVSGRVALPKHGHKFAVTIVSIDQPALRVTSTTTAPDGTFSIDGVPSGAYHLLVSGPVVNMGSEGAILDAQPLFGRGLLEVAGQNVDGLTISVDEGRSVSLSLRVASPGPTTSCGLRGSVTLAPLEDWGAALAQRVDVEFAAGRILAHLAPGPYQATVAEPNNVCLGGHTVTTTFDPQQASSMSSVALQIIPAGSIRGQINTDAKRAQGLAALLVPSSPIDGTPAMHIAFPDANSRFTFSRLRPGKYHIITRRVADSLQVSSVPDSSRMVEIEVYRGSRLDAELPGPIE